MVTKVTIIIIGIFVTLVTEITIVAIKSNAMVVPLVTCTYLTIAIKAHLQGPLTMYDVISHSLFLLLKVLLSTIRLVSTSNHGDLTVSG
jgi:hypothetical protein